MIEVAVAHPEVSQLAALNVAARKVDETDGRLQDSGNAACNPRKFYLSGSQKIVIAQILEYFPR